MEKAYVLLTIETGSEKEVLNALDEIPDVKEAYQIHGIQKRSRYNFIIRVEAETLKELDDLINSRIKDIRKIRSTLSLLILIPLPTSGPLSIREGFVGYQKNRQ